MFNAVKGARNPQAMLQNMAMQNPNLQQAMDYVKANGGNAQQAFYKLAQERGIDPNAVLNQFR